MSNYELAVGLLATPFGVIVGAIIASGTASTAYIWWADR